MSDKILIVVAGPTAVGKTSVAIRLAHEFNTCVVSADSRQIFREMTIGTAKPSEQEREQVPHYFIDRHSVVEEYDAARYAREALKVIGDLFQQHSEVILCGGSGLYIRGVCEGFDEMPEVPDDVRREVVDHYKKHGLRWLQDRMLELDPVGFQGIDQKNPQRLMRALEVSMYTGQSIQSFRKNERKQRNFYSVKLGLELPRDELYARIDSRVDQMIAAGLFDEARKLYPLRHYNALQTVGYQEVFDFMDNRYDLDECVRLLKRNTRRYAKRQLTWFKKDREFKWYPPDAVEDMIRYVRSWREKLIALGFWLLAVGF